MVRLVLSHSQGQETVPDDGDNESCEESSTKSTPYAASPLPPPPPIQVGTVVSYVAVESCRFTADSILTFQQEIPVCRMDTYNVAHDDAQRL